MTSGLSVDVGPGVKPDLLSQVEAVATATAPRRDFFHLFLTFRFFFQTKQHTLDILHKLSQPLKQKNRAVVNIFLFLTLYPNEKVNAVKLF